MSHDIEQHNAAPSATRRTVLTGAAWSVPVIAAASLAPLAAASDTVTLAFDKSTYNGTACGTISGAYVTVTVNGVATAGKSVTTTLSNGYKFSDGTTTNTQVSGSDGRVSLPAISVPAVGGTGTFSAVSSQSTTTATVIAPTVKAIGLEKNNSYFSPLPAGIAATSVGVCSDYGWHGYVLGNDSYLYSSLNGGAWTKTSPAGVTHFSVDSMGYSAIYTTGTKVGLDYNNSYFPALPAGVSATTVGFCSDYGIRGYFLGSDSYLYMSLNGGAWTKTSPAGVTNFSIDSTGYSAIYTTGTSIGLEKDNSYFPALPAGITATSVGVSSNYGWHGYFLGSDGYLYTSINAGAWTKTSPAGVTNFSMDSKGYSAIYALSPSNC